MEQEIWKIGDSIYTMYNNRIQKGIITDIDEDETKKLFQNFRVKFHNQIVWVNEKQLHKSIDLLVHNLKLEFSNELNKQDESH